MDLIELQRRADSGSCVAQTILGVYLLDGIGTETNPEAAHHYLHVAALQGGSRAMVNLGRMYFEGIGVPKDVHESIRWYESAASAGEFLAQIAARQDLLSWPRDHARFSRRPKVVFGGN